MNVLGDSVLVYPYALGAEWLQSGDKCDMNAGRECRVKMQDAGKAAGLYFVMCLQ